MIRSVLLLALALLVLPACSMTDDEEPNFGIRVVDDLAAPEGGGFTLFSLRDTSVVVADPQDSFAWDIGFDGTEIIVNGGTSGPGAGVGAFVDRPFDEVTDAVSDSLGNGPVYRRDGESPCPTGPDRVVCAGPDNGWYTTAPLADGPGQAIVPIPGRVLVLRLADNSGYAKVQFQSYYRGDPDAPGAASEGGFYTFRYVANEFGTALVD